MAQQAASSQRYSADCGWDAEQQGKKQMPSHGMSSRSNPFSKDAVRKDRSRLNKAFDGVFEHNFVSSKPGTAVNISPIGLLVDFVFRVRGSDICRVQLLTGLAGLGMHS
jgi:hypothetical protein